MRRLATTFLFVVSAVSLLVLPVQAEKVVDVRALGSVEAEPIVVGRAPTQQCQVGNLNPASWAVGGWFAAPEEYALVFEPAATCTLCPIGFDVNTVHIILQSAGVCTLFMAVDMEEVAYPNSDDCPEPAAEICNSGLFQVTLPGAGVYDIGLPIECPCRASGATYALSVYFEDATCDPDIITDELPSNCTSWNDWGAGWFDLVAEAGFPGNLIVFADAECCEVSASEPSTWGQTKGLYR